MYDGSLLEHGAQLPPQSIPLSPMSRKPFSHVGTCSSFFLHEENMIIIVKNKNDIIRIVFNLI
jgi:hypothetical protein